MSKYTTEVRFICETEAGLIESAGYSDIDSILTTSAPKIFSFDFPIFDEAYRLPLEKKILKHYYTREISEETVGLWKLKLDDKMNMIMPYFNQLYNSELIKFDPMTDTNIHTTHAGDESGEATNEHSYTQKTDTTKSGIDSYNETIQNTDKETGTGSVVNDSTGTQNDNTKHSESGTNVSDGNREISGNEKGKNSNTDNTTNYELFSDTPQGGLSGVDSETYLTTAKKTLNDNAIIGTNETENTQNETNNNTTMSTINSSDNNERTTSTESNTISSDNRDREHNENRSTDRENIESSKTDYTNQGTGGNTFSNTNQYIENVIGKRGYGSYSKMLMEFRDTFLNIDEMIINALEPLFFGLW